MYMSNMKKVKNGMYVNDIFVSPLSADINRDPTQAYVGKMHFYCLIRFHNQTKLTSVAKDMYLNPMW